MTEGECFRGHRQLCASIIAAAKLITVMGHGDIRFICPEAEARMKVRATKQRKSARK